MKLGARIFKTGIAIMVALYVAILAGLEPPMFAALAAMFAIQPSIYRSVQTILEQFQANILGAVLAVIFVLTFGHAPFVVGVVVVIAIAIIMRLKLEPSTIPLAIVTIIVIMESPSENFIEFAALRFVLIIIGVLSAFLVNLFFLPPRYETKLYLKIVNKSEQINQWITLFMRKDANHSALKKEITKINESMVKLENLYLLYKEERNYFAKNRYSKARKVVLFRQMIATTKKALFLLKNLERREYELYQMPDKLPTLIRLQLELLTAYHDRILLRYSGKVTHQANDEMVTEMQQGKEELTEYFLELYENQAVDREQWLHILPILTHIIEYEEKLQHLDHLVDTFFTYHQKENKVTIKEPEE
ncbi:aromatic acid exporter family protein [Alkalihalobacterium bogoriense]|uniref:aromatic acid exporter family protein n=1 Tax=Alkalihalobacterium bogoriense TaxID=246272 RepID=UPI00047EE435|nr:aromatic acid exporter family protein [Alkalihalobacterium bogoriense]